MLPSSVSPNPACPLCGTADIPVWHRDARRAYHCCPGCRLVFVPVSGHVSPEAERAHYDLHENSLTDPAYRRFLSRIAAPVIARLPLLPASSSSVRGIDVGCGPAPLLAQMLSEAGVDMAVYDPFFAPDTSVLARRYDVVTASEVVEHFRAPAQGFAQLFGLVAPGGLLAVMTKRPRDLAAFARWHYILDPTHVAFYDVETFRWLAGRYGAQLEVVGDDVVVFRVSANENAGMTEASRP